MKLTQQDYKVNPVNLSTYLRLYPSVDGLAANGLRYGAAAEIRVNFGNNQNGLATTTAGTNVVPSGTALGPSAYSSTQTLFLRRAFAYMGADQIGIVRI